MPSQISIHALLAESDTLIDDVSTGGKIFLSTLSLRRATFKQILEGVGNGFLSTLSLRRATKVAVGVVLHGGISIHALLAESDASGRWKSAGW